MPEMLLALNCGSSSLKCTLFDYPSLKCLATASASSINSANATLKIKSCANSSSHQESAEGQSHDKIFSHILQSLTAHLKIETAEIKVVTHRIVHGGTFTEPLKVTTEHQEALEKMDELSAFAPLHNHHAVLTVRTALELLPDATNVLCFDTLFHTSLPECVYTYPVDTSSHISPVPLRKYGFHGLSYSSILKRVSKYLDKPMEETCVIICHLGSGASICCIKNGKSIDTTMGLTPLEGLPGGTRSGSVDPSLVFHLFDTTEETAQMTETKGMAIAKAELKLNKESGFQGMCGTNEFGTIIQIAKEGDAKMKLVVDVFENRILGYLGSYLLLLRNRPDAIIFSGGIGEKSADLRDSILSKLDYLGVEVDTSKNDVAATSDEIVLPITTHGSKILGLRVLTNEELECAEIAMDVLDGH